MKYFDFQNQESWLHFVYKISKAFSPTFDKVKNADKNLENIKSCQRYYCYHESCVSFDKMVRVEKACVTWRNVKNLKVWS